MFSKVQRIEQSQHSSFVNFAQCPLFENGFTEYHRYCIIKISHKNTGPRIVANIAICSCILFTTIRGSSNRASRASYFPERFARISVEQIPGVLFSLTTFLPCSLHHSTIFWNLSLIWSSPRHNTSTSKSPVVQEGGYTS